MIRVGRYEIASIVNGWFRLDGGAMFGVVPKVMWQEDQDVDDLNRILMATRTLVIADREAGRVMLVDTGTGSKWSGREADRYAVRDLPGSLPDGLARMGMTPDDVTDVVISHAHFDHAGGLTEWTDGPGSEPRPRFPSARHWVHAGHFEHAMHPHDKDRASFMERDFAVLASAGLLERVRGDDPPGPLPGIRWLLSHGHTPWMMLPLVEDAEPPLLFTGDMIPTSAHLPPPWVMAYDVQPLVTIEEKKRVLEMCRERGLRLAFPHDRRLGGAEVDLSGRRPRVRSPLDLAP